MRINSLSSRLKLLTVSIPEREFDKFAFNVSIASLILVYLEAMVLVNLNEPKNAKLFAILLPRGDQEWINYINHWIADQKNKGFFNQTAEKFGL